MSGQIPEEFISDLRHRADIVAVIGEYVPLKKQGRNYIGLCPFHSEKTPSFVVSPDKQIYHCFGCGKGGNVFSFLMEKNAMTFPEAVGHLAKQCGLNMPHSDVSPEKARQDTLKKKYYHINKLSAEFFHKLLYENAGHAALEYLLARGLEKKTIEKFLLGYAPPGRGKLTLTRYLLDNGFGEEELLKLGLSVKTEKGRIIDRFRERIIFPIMDETGKVIGFGGRVLDDVLPKYLNSPDTPLFRKGKHLYGLNLAKASIREQDRIIIMEGYMDVITAHQHGLTNVVGSLGTAFTPEQARLLMRYTYNAHICFDADTAGQNAALRGMDVLQEQGCYVSVISLDAAKDPDDFIKKEGGARFTELVERAHTLLEYKLIRLLAENNPQSVPGKIQVVQELTADILKAKSPVARQAFIQLVAEKLALPETAIHAEIRKASLQRTSVDNTLKSKVKSKTAGEKAQRMIIKLVVENPEHLVITEKWGGSNLFYLQPLKEIYQNYYVIRQAGHNIKANDLLSFLDEPQTQDLLTEILLEEEAPQDTTRVLQDCLALLKAELLEGTIRDMNSKMSAYENRGEVSKALELMAQIQQLVKEKHSLATSLRKGGSNYEV